MTSPNPIPNPSQVTLPLETVVVQLQTQQTQLQTQPKGDNERRSAVQLARALWRAGPWKVYLPLRLPYP